MITVHPANATNFATNGLGVLMPTEAVIYEAINGEYGIDLRHPIDPGGRWRLLQEERIIVAPGPGGIQPYRIVTVEVDMMGDISVTARHLSGDLIGAMIVNRAPTDAPASEALSIALDGTAYAGWSDVPSIASARWVHKNPLAAIMGEDDNSIVSRWGGEVERDGYSINVRQRLGADRGVTVRYRKNLTGLIGMTDIGSVVTRILPTGLQEGGNVVLELPELYVDSPYIDNYVQVYATHIHYGDIQVSEDLPEAEALDMLRAAAAATFAGGADLPIVSLSVNFVDLSQTVEYKDYAALERVYLGDTVHVYHGDLGIDLALRVVDYRWDAIRERYDEITLGNPARSITTTIATQTQRQETIEQRQSDLDAAITAVTAYLSNPGNSYIRMVPDISNPAEIYAMDTPDPATAQSVIRMNAAGIGVSNTGIAGPYVTAMTGAGINAEAITAGVIRSEVIFAGLLDAVKGSFDHLVAGVPGAQRLEMGTDDAGEPYASVYDDSNVERVSLRMDGLRLLDGGTRIVPYSIGNRVGVGIFVE